MGALWFLFLVVVFPAQKVGYLMSAMCIVALLNVAFLILQEFNIDPLIIGRFNDPDPPVGLYTNSNEASATLAFCTPAFLRGRWKYGLIPVGLGLVLTRSIAGTLAAGLGMYAYGIWTRQLWLSTSVLLLGAGAFLWPVGMRTAPGENRAAQTVFCVVSSLFPR